MKAQGVRSDNHHVRPTRRSIGTIGALVLTLVMSLLAMPSAGAARPTRSVFEATGGVLSGVCAFDVEIEPADGPITSTVTEFSDGRVQTSIRHGDILMTNLTTGDSIVHHSQYLFVDVFDAAADTIRSSGSGTWWTYFLPGDVGPDGSIVGEPVFLSMTGHAEGTFDTEPPFAITSFEFQGRINADLCALLGPG